MRILITALLAAVTSITAAGCPAFIKAIPVIAAALSESSTVLDAISAVSDKYYAQHLDADRAEYDTAMSATRTSLAAAAYLSRGAEHMTQEQTDAAWEDFYASYNKLLGVLGPLGVVAVSGDDAMRTAPEGALLVPRADELVPKI